MGYDPRPALGVPGDVDDARYDADLSLAVAVTSDVGDTVNEGSLVTRVILYQVRAYETTLLLLQVRGP